MNKYNDVTMSIGVDHMISVREITEENFRTIIQLSDTLDESQKKSVAPNVVSIAQAYVNQERA